MNQNMNEELGFMGSLLKKAEIELFDLQHIRVEERLRQRMLGLQVELIRLTGNIHVLYDQIKEEYRELLPEPIPYDAPKPLSTSAEALTRLRRFDGNESVNNQIDFFEHETDSNK